MLRKELLIGFVVAAFLAALVPTAFWQSIFLTGHGFASSLENVIIGPFCSDHCAHRFDAEAPSTPVAKYISVSAANDPGTTETAVDPVCGMTIDRRTALQAVDRDGSTVFFCSKSCRSLTWPTHSTSPGQQPRDSDPADRSRPTWRSLTTNIRSTRSGSPTPAAASPALMTLHG